MKKGIEDWQPAFEAAGFRNAIVAREAPADDPDWSAEDARYSVIRWLPSTTENAQGPHIHDPRSGEILEADIQMYHNVQNLAKNWYFVQVGPLDPRARKLPLPDDLMGELIRYVVAHEVGHTLGFQHNMKASAMYTARAGARQGVGQAERPHADAHGLLALQLRRAARGRHRSGRPHSEDRPVRQVGDDVGLQADPGRRRRRTRRRPTLDAWARAAGPDAVATASRPRRRAAAIRATRPRPSAMPTRCAPRTLGLKNLQRVAGPAARGDDDADRATRIAS